jgi:hypothetical protein
LDDYVTSDNVHLHKGQHVQLINRVNNELCVVQLLNNTVDNNNSSSLASPNSLNNSSTTTTSASTTKREVTIPISLIKCRVKPSTAISSLDESDDKINAAKRKGSFKSWIRSSHRKFAGIRSQREREAAAAASTANKYNDIENIGKVKVITSFNNN